MEARTSTPQRREPPKVENPPEYEKIVSNSNFNDNCSVYSDVSRATSRASRSRRHKSSRDKSVSIQAPSKSTRYTEGLLYFFTEDDYKVRKTGAYKVLCSPIRSSKCCAYKVVFSIFVMFSPSLKLFGIKIECLQLSAKTFVIVTQVTRVLNDFNVTKQIEFTSG